MTEIRGITSSHKHEQSKACGTGGIWSCSESWEVLLIQTLLRATSSVAPCISPFPNATMKPYSLSRTQIPEWVHFLV